MLSSNGQIQKANSQGGFEKFLTHVGHPHGSPRMLLKVTAIFLQHFVGNRF